MKYLDPNLERRSAIFIDFENFFYTLSNEYGLSQDDSADSAISIIGSALDEVSEKTGIPIIKLAFADWSELSKPKRELQRMGIRIVDVLSTVHKNSADIELSLSAQEVVLTRDDIDFIVIFAGDRDYMPVALRIIERGKRLHLVGFESSLSGDLKKQVGKGNYTLVSPSISPTISKKTKPSGASDLPQNSGQHLPRIKGLSIDQTKALIAAVKSFDEYKEKFGSVRLSVFLVVGLQVF